MPEPIIIIAAIQAIFAGILLIYIIRQKNIAGRQTDIAELQYLHMILDVVKSDDPDRPSLEETYFAKLYKWSEKLDKDLKLPKKTRMIIKELIDDSRKEQSTNTPE